MCKADKMQNGDAIAVELPRVPGLFFHSKLFDAASLGKLIDLNNCTTASIEVGSELYNMVCSYLSENSNSNSFSLRIANSSSCKKGGCGKRVTSASLGLGVFSFTYCGRTIYASHEAVGEPVGTECAPAIMQSLTLIVEGVGEIKLLQSLCDELIEKADRTDKKAFTVYRWMVSHCYWRRDTTVSARPVESVVLPSATKAKVVDDMADFLSAETSDWYINHGIPYKRAFLFHGAPGAGKTSLIQALAGRYQRNVCYLSPTHPDMTDDNLKSAVQMVPSNSILVLEDIDALFGSKREKKVDKSPLTFSGLLNAIDGVGGATGQIFILTTNHREKLDPALIRNGRVDVHVPFFNADAEQMAMLFRQFYPVAEDGLAQAFATNLTEQLKGETVSMAALQHYFIVMRSKSAAEAAEGVAEIVAEMNERSQKVDAKPESAEDEKEAKDEKTTTDKVDEKPKADPNEGKNGKSEATGIHVHVHLPDKL